MDKAFDPNIILPLIAGIGAGYGKVRNWARNRRYKRQPWTRPLQPTSTGGRKRKRPNPPRAPTAPRDIRKRRKPTGGGGGSGVNWVGGNGTTYLVPGRNRRKYRRKIRLRQDYLKFSAPDTHMYRDMGRIANFGGLQAVFSFPMNETQNSLETYLKIHPISNAGAGTGQQDELDIRNLKDAFMKYKIKKKLTLKNNYNYKVKIFVWDAFSKTKTANTISNDFTSGLVEKDITSSSTFAATTIGIKPKDAGAFFLRRWAMKNFRMVEIAPGEEVIVTYKSNIRNYHREDLEDEKAEYDKGSHQFFVIMQGCIVHDQTTTSNVNFSEGALDYDAYSRISVWVAYGGDRKNFTSQSTTGAITTGVHTEHTDHGVEVALV